MICPSTESSHDVRASVTAYCRGIKIRVGRQIRIIVGPDAEPGRGAEAASAGRSPAPQVLLGRCHHGPDRRLLAGLLLFVAQLQVVADPADQAGILGLPAHHRVEVEVTVRQVERQHAARRRAWRDRAGSPRARASAPAASRS